MESPGDILREARRRKGLSPEEVFRQTRVRPVLLDHLEEDVLSALPENPYGRSLYRMVASAVGADVERVLAAYDELLELRGDTVREPEEEPPPTQRRPLGFILAISILAVLAGALWILQRTEGPPPPVAVESQPEQVEGGVDETSSSAVQDEAPAPAIRSSGTTMPPAGIDPTGPPVRATWIPDPQEEEELEGDGEVRHVLLLNSDQFPEGMSTESRQLILEVRAVFETWIWLRADGRRTRQGNLQVGEERIWLATDEFLMKLGRSDGLELTLNGRPVIVPSSRSGVVRFRLSWQELAAAVTPDDSGPS